MDNLEKIIVRHDDIAETENFSADLSIYRGMDKERLKEKERSTLACVEELKKQKRTWFSLYTLAEGGLLFCGLAAINAVLDPYQLSHMAYNISLIAGIAAFIFWKLYTGKYKSSEQSCQKELKAIQIVKIEREHRG